MGIEGERDGMEERKGMEGEALSAWRVTGQKDDGDTGIKSAPRVVFKKQ